MPATRESRFRLLLRAGSLVFGVSALILIAVPGFFNQLLGFETNSALEWAMRMICITLVALAGNLFSVSTRGSDESVLLSGRVMFVSAAGFGFSAAYLWAMVSKI